MLEVSAYSTSDLNWTRGIRAADSFLRAVSKNQKPGGNDVSTVTRLRRSAETLSPTKPVDPTQPRYDTDFIALKMGFAKGY
jgi:hypothetical protein